MSFPTLLVFVPSSLSLIAYCLYKHTSLGPVYPADHLESFLYPTRQPTPSLSLNPVLFERTGRGFSSPPPARLTGFNRHSGTSVVAWFTSRHAQIPLPDIENSFCFAGSSQKMNTFPNEVSPQIATSCPLQDVEILDYRAPPRNFPLTSMPAFDICFRIFYLASTSSPSLFFFPCCLFFSIETCGRAAFFFPPLNVWRLSNKNSW